MISLRAFRYYPNKSTIPFPLSTPSPSHIQQQSSTPSRKLHSHLSELITAFFFLKDKVNPHLQKIIQRIILSLGLVFSSSFPRSQDHVSEENLHSPFPLFKLFFSPPQITPSPQPLLCNINLSSISHQAQQVNRPKI